MLEVEPLVSLDVPLPDESETGGAYRLAAIGAIIVRIGFSVMV